LAKSIVMDNDEKEEDDEDFLLESIL